MNVEDLKSIPGSVESLRDIHRNVEDRLNKNNGKASNYNNEGRVLPSRDFGNNYHNNANDHPFFIKMEEANGKATTTRTSFKTTVLEDSVTHSEDAGSRKKKKNPFFMLSIFRMGKKKASREKETPVFDHLSPAFKIKQNDNFHRVGLDIFHQISKPIIKKSELQQTKKRSTSFSPNDHDSNSRPQTKEVGDFTSVDFEVDSCDYSEDYYSRPSAPEPTLPIYGSHHHTNSERSTTANQRPPLPFFPTVFHRGRALPPLERRPPVILHTPENSQDSLESWMTCLSEELKRVPLNQLFIPGSHDSFSFSLAAEEQIGPDAPDVVAGLDSCCPCLARPAIMRWSITQRAPVTAQLKHGIRYFDIRVAVRNSRFYFVHGLYGEDLEPLLSEIQHFLVKHPGEVVLLDFQHFHGLNEQDHMALITLLKHTFAERLCPSFEQLKNLTLAYLTRLKYQVLVFYRHQASIEAVSWLWPSESIPNPWPQTTSVSKMITFLEEKLKRRNPQTFFVTQCILTPSSKYLIRKVSGMLEKDMARPCNRVVGRWVGHLPHGPQGPNIIMTDFVEHDDWAVPRAVIKRNSTLVIQPTPLQRY